MDRQKLGRILFYALYQDVHGPKEFTGEEADEVMEFLGFEAFVDCDPYGYMGLKDLQNNEIVSGCYID